MLITRSLPWAWLPAHRVRFRLSIYKAIYNFGSSGSDLSRAQLAPLTQTPGGKLIGTVDSGCQGGQNGAAFEIGYQG